MGKCRSLALDPTRKPLLHFYPVAILSWDWDKISCDFCQNWQISQVGKDEVMGERNNVTAEELVNLASSRGAMDYMTYNEPSSVRMGARSPDLGKRRISQESWSPMDLRQEALELPLCG